MTLSRLAPYSRFGWLARRRRQLAVEHWLRRLAVKARHAGQQVQTLSGGNQQKVALARVLHQEADILLLGRADPRHRRRDEGRDLSPDRGARRAGQGGALRQLLSAGTAGDLRSSGRDAARSPGCRPPGLTVDGRSGDGLRHRRRIGGRRMNDPAKDGDRTGTAAADSALGRGRMGAARGTAGHRAAVRAGGSGVGCRPVRLDPQFASRAESNLDRRGRGARHDAGHHRRRHRFVGRNRLDLVRDRDGLLPEKRLARLADLVRGRGRRLSLRTAQRSPDQRSARGAVHRHPGYHDDLPGGGQDHLRRIDRVSRSGPNPGLAPCALLHPSARSDLRSRAQRSVGCSARRGAGRPGGPAAALHGLRAVSLCAGIERVDGPAVRHQHSPGQDRRLLPRGLFRRRRRGIPFRDAEDRQPQRGTRTGAAGHRGGGDWGRQPQRRARFGGGCLDRCGDHGRDSQRLRPVGDPQPLSGDPRIMRRARSLDRGRGVSIKSCVQRERAVWTPALRAYM